MVGKLEGIVGCVPVKDKWVVLRGESYMLSIFEERRPRDAIPPFLLLPVVVVVVAAAVEIRPRLVVEICLAKFERAIFEIKIRRNLKNVC